MTPDARCFAKIGSAREAFESLSRCLEYGEGVGIVTGATGSGKSLLCLALAAELENRFETAFLAGEDCSSYSLFLKTILMELDEPVESDEKFELQNRLKKYAGKSQRHRSGIVLLIDETQSLNKKICEGLRVISNWNARGKPLVRILLSGNWNFEEMLMSPEFEFLNERVGAHVILESFSKQETSAYIDFRIRHHGGKTLELFTKEALDAIGRISEGVPRVVNLLCDRSLHIAFENDEKPVSFETVCEAVEKLKHLSIHLNEIGIANPVEKSDSSVAIDSHPIATEMDSNDADDAECFVFEVGESTASLAKTQQHDQQETSSSGDDFAEEESYAFEIEDSEASNSKRERGSMNDILIDANEEVSSDSVESNVREDCFIENGQIENSSMETVDISGDSLEIGENRFLDRTKIEVENSIPDEVANKNGDLEATANWKKIPLDLRWNDSTTSTFKSSDSVTPETVEKERGNRSETLVVATSSQKYARIRPEQLLQTLVLEGLAENCEGIESDSSWLRNNDTKIFDCIANEPVSYRDDTYHRMKDDYGHSPELVEDVSSVASTSCESEVARSLLLLLENVEDYFSVEPASSIDSGFQSGEKNLETDALLEIPTRIHNSPVEMYDTVLPENAYEEREASSYSRVGTHAAMEFELPKLKETDEYRYLLSELYRRESS